jgi:RNA polymerase sigma-70 factor (ECF subfamily)
VAITETDFRQAFEQHKDAVYDFALRMTASPAAAEDVAQDCFLELLRNPRGFDPSRGSLRMFLFGVARHLVYRYWRKQNRSVPMNEDMLAYSPDLTAASLSEMIREAVQALPEFQREAVVLFEYEGFTLEEIAGLTGVEIGTVKSRLHRARENLRTVLAPLRSGVHQ